MVGVVGGYGAPGGDGALTRPRACHAAAVQIDAARPTGPIVLAVLAGIGHLVVGYFYLAGGLVIPGPVLVVLWLFWLVLAAVLVRLSLNGSWWTPVVPLVAAAVLVLSLVVGGNLLGWQA